MSLFGKFLGVGGATSASRVLGFVREAMIAAALGAGPVADAFYAALRFPNLFRRLFAEGAFNSAFVPIFAKEVEANGEESAAQFAGEVFSVLALVLAVLTAIALAFMPFLAATVIAPAFQDTPDKFDLTVLLARIMFPYLAAMSLVAMLSGVLNSFRKYFLAALAPVLLNIVLIGVLLMALNTGWDDRLVGVALAIGVVVAGLLQLGLLVYGLMRLGFRFSPKRPRLTPQVKRLLTLAAPAALTGGIVQINLVIGQIIASQQDGAIALLNYADRIYQLPLGVIGIAIGVVLLPELARALGAGEQKTALTLQNRSLEFGLGLTVPAAVALALTPVPFNSPTAWATNFGQIQTAATEPCSVTARWVSSKMSAAVQSSFRFVRSRRPRARFAMSVAERSAMSNLLHKCSDEVFHARHAGLRNTLGLIVGQFLRLQACTVVGDDRQGGNPQPQKTGHDHFRNGGHANRIRTQHLRHADFGRRLEGRAGEPHVNTFRQRTAGLLRHLFHDAAQLRIVSRTHVEEPFLVLFADQRVLAGPVDVVGNQHRATGRHVLA